MANLLQRLFSAVIPKPRARPFSEMGVSGTAVYGGYVQTREKSPQWRGRQRYITSAEMAVNTSIVAAGIHHFLNLISHPKWTVRPADESAKAQELADFFEEVMNDVDTPWSRVVRRAGMFRFHGFGVQEWTAMRRKDGSVCFRDIEPRPQHTIERWIISETGEVEGVIQRAPQTGEDLAIPRSKIVYLVDDTLSDSPEGMGIFRQLAAPYERLQTYYDLEARAFERDLRGIPVGRVPYTKIRKEVTAGRMSQEDANTLTQQMERFVQMQIKQPDTGITLDSIPYESEAADGRKVSGMPQWAIELIQGSANGVGELGAAIVRTQMEMARVLSSEHLMMGESSGNRALSEDKSRNLYLIANAVLEDIRAAFNADLIEPIWTLNNFDEKLKPELEVEEVAFKNAETIAGVLAQIAQAGAPLMPDDPVIEDVRELMGVSAPPPIDPEMLGMLMGGGAGANGDGTGGGKPDDGTGKKPNGEGSSTDDFNEEEEDKDDAESRDEKPKGKDKKTAEGRDGKTTGTRKKPAKKSVRYRVKKD